jgi:heavy metal sensor kinase
MRLPRKRDLRRITRGLRFRLTATYALFFTVLFIGVAAYFRYTLIHTLDNQVHDLLDARWSAIKGAYLRIEPNADLHKNSADWYYDPDDPDEVATVSDLKKIYMIADEHGNIVQSGETKEPEYSSTYDDIGLDPPDLVQKRVREAFSAMKPGAAGKTFWDVRQNRHGERFLIRAGIVLDEAHLTPGRRYPYYVAIGAPLADSEKVIRKFTLREAAIIPGALILGSLLGWLMTGRALTPVMEVAQTAQRISGSNLSLRIPSRQSGDELDYLVLTFNRMIERLEASFQQIKQFSTDVSHELRTPITAIRGQLEVALFTAKTTDQYREAMFNALQDIDRLSQIVRALLLLSQAESGQLVLQKTRLNLCEVAEDLVEQFQIPAEEAGIRLTAELPPQCPAEVDRVQIERMITNLLSNAIKFTPRGGEVRLALHVLSHGIEVVVEDTGQGIATEYLPHIFDRFYRVPGSGSAPSPDQGLGLGLSFVAWIVKAHGGKIVVESEPGRGTRFRITLPDSGVGSDTMELNTQPATLA